MRKTGLVTATFGAGILASGAVAHAQFFNIATTFTGTNVTNGDMVDIAGDNAWVYDNSTPASTSGNIGVPTAVTFLSLTPTTPKLLPAHPTLTETFSTSYTISYTLTNTGANGSQNLGSTSGTLKGLLFGMMTTSGGDPNPDTNSVVFSDESPGLGSPIDLSAGGRNFFVTFSVQNPGIVNYASDMTASPAILTGTFSSGTPEPGATAMLFGMGLSGGLFAYRHRRRTGSGFGIRGSGIGDRNGSPPFQSSERNAASISGY